MELFKKKPVIWLDYELSAGQYQLAIKVPSRFSQNYPIEDPISIDTLDTFNESTPKLLFVRYWDFFSFMSAEPVGDFSVKIQLERIDNFEKMSKSEEQRALRVEHHIIGKLKSAYEHTNKRLIEKSMEEKIVIVPTHLDKAEINGHNWMLCQVSGGARFDKYTAILGDNHLLNVVFHYSVYAPKHKNWIKKAVAQKQEILSHLKLYQI